MHIKQRAIATVLCMIFLSVLRYAVLFALQIKKHRRLSNPIQFLQRQSR